jgi:uncharacterized protein with PIN domain
MSATELLQARMRANRRRVDKHLEAAARLVGWRQLMNAFQSAEKGWTMKSLDEHNEDRRRTHIEYRNVVNRAGVACPKCGAEMEIDQPGVVNASLPPSQWVTCPACQYQGLKTL